MPPAFALSQDQTLRFISARIATQDSPERSRSINEQTRTHGSVPIHPGQRHHDNRNILHKRNCNASKKIRIRHALKHQTNKSRVLLKPRPISPDRPISPTLAQQKPEGAANVSLPSICNCQRPKQRHPQPRISGPTARLALLSTNSAQTENLACRTGDSKSKSSVRCGGSAM